MHDAICVKCGNNCQVPFRPTAGKDIFCSECFEKGGSQDRKLGARTSGGNSDEELKTINIKLDMIMTALGLSGPKKEKKSKKEPYISKADRKVTEKEELTKKTVAKKPAKKKVVEKKKEVAKKVAKKTTKKATETKPKAKAKKVVNKKAVAKKKK